MRLWRESESREFREKMASRPKPARRWNTKNEILLNAVIKGQFSTVKRLVERSFTDINSKNPHGMSCLQLAVIHGHYKLAEYLIQRGIDMNSADQDGWTALHDAALRNTRSISRKLISKGCDIVRATNMGELPIDLAWSLDMEILLCEHMVARGEGELARQYSVYLGLEHLGNGRGREASQLEGSQYRPVHSMEAKPTLALQEPSFSNSNSSQGQSAAGKERGQPSVGLRTSLRNRSNAEVKSSLTRISEEVINDHPQSIRSQPLYEPATSLPASISSPRRFFSPQLPRRDFSYSSASLCISKDDLVTSTSSTAREDCFDALAPLQHNQRPSGTSPQPSGRKVSFATDLDLSLDAMARTKLSHSSSEPVVVEKAILTSPPSSTGSSRQSSSSDLCSDSPLSSLSVEDVARLSSLYKETCEADKACDSDGSTSSGFDPDEAISKLKMRPRKSSIATPNGRRQSENGKRRSVSFQPEVLLHSVVTVGDIQEVKQVLQSGVISDVNKMSPAGLTALHQSAIDGNLECAETLIRNGADVNSMDCEQWTPLHAAAMSGHISLVQFLLNAGADSSLRNDEGETPYDVARTGAVRKLLLCAMNGKNPDADDFSDGEYSGEEEEEYSHAESESDSDSEEEDTASSPLFGSSKSMLKERLGLHHTALKNTREASVSPSPDLDALDSVFTASTETLVADQRRERESLDSTSSYGSLFEHELDRTRVLDTHRRHRSNLRTPESDTEKVSEDQGISTMEGSSDCSHRGRMLSEDEGTSRDVLDSDLVPGSLDYRFQEAVMYCDVDSVLKLVRHKHEINVNRVNKNSGITALHHAVLEENFALVQHLVKDFEAGLNIKDVDGWTPLHAASAVGNICIAQYLLDSGSKPSILNNHCEFPVDVAEDIAMEKLLKNAMLGPSVGKIFKGIFT